MDWIRENWFWLAVAVLFVWMHMKMHGGHGGHGGHPSRAEHGGHGGHGGGGGCCAHPDGHAPNDDSTRKEERHAGH